MSLITRCPACKTMFKVVPDQLRISEGWVRCGQCDEIFDASAHMQGKESRDSKPAAPQAHDAQGHESRPRGARQAEVPAAQTLNDPLVQETVSGGAAISETVADEAVEPTLDDATLPAPETTYGPDVQLDGPNPQEDSRLQELSFMRDAKSRSRWRRPWVRAGLTLLSLLLCLVLALQLLVNERDRIAAVEPDLKPWIEQVCSVMDCVVEPLRQIESVVIDSSSFNKIRGDVYRLNFSLKNTAPIELALPAIELSLTDVHDQPIMRRVFKPGELGFKSDVLRAASEFNTSLTLGIKTNGGAERVAGYRILAFYP
jgi:predicted Zn finger-like uncharacterized protein